jgi:hypothetical protein
MVKTLNRLRSKYFYLKSAMVKDENKEATNMRTGRLDSEIEFGDENTFR